MRRDLDLKREFEFEFEEDEFEVDEMITVVEMSKLFNTDNIKEESKFSEELNSRMFNAIDDAISVDSFTNSSTLQTSEDNEVSQLSTLSKLGSSVSDKSRRF